MSDISSLKSGAKTQNTGRVMAFRCPVCTCGVLSAVSPENIPADKIVLKCDCKQSHVTLTFSKDAPVRLSVPCPICQVPHTFSMTREALFHRDIQTLSCPLTGVDIFHVGDTNLVKAALATSEYELSQIMSEDDASRLYAMSAQNAGSDEPDTNTEVNPEAVETLVYALKELADEGRIYCPCHPDGVVPGDDETSPYIVDGGRDGRDITVSCPCCRAAVSFPIGTVSLPLAYKWLDADSLTLEPLS